MAWQVTVPIHEQDTFDETLDTAVQEQDAALVPLALSEDDIRLRDYLIRKVKEMVADAPIVSTHLVASIGGHANSGANVHIPGSGTSVGFWIEVSAAAALPVQAPLAQQEQSQPVAPPHALAGIARHLAPGHQGTLTATGRQAVPTIASPTVPSTDEVEVPGAVEEPEVVPTDAPVGQPAELVVPPVQQGQVWTPSPSAGGDAPADEAPFVG